MHIDSADWIESGFLLEEPIIQYLPASLLPVKEKYFLVNDY